MGKKINKRFKSPKFLIPVGIVLALVVGYLFLCVIAGSNDYFSNTKINGIDVSGMTKQEAADALEKQYQDDCNNLSMSLKAGEEEYIVSLKDNLVFDANGTAVEVSDELHNSFLMKGYYYLCKGDFTTGVSVKDEEVLTQSITDSKILDYDTKVDTTYKLEGDKIIFTKGTTGEKTDIEDIKTKINNALNTYQFKDVIVCNLVKSAPNESEMETLYKEICHEVQNATLDKENNYAVIESKVGVDYDLETAVKALNKASEGEEFSVEATITEPKISKEMLEKYLFRDVLGTYTTYVSGSSVRRGNVKLAGNKCDGTILLPGEEFSYNGVVGQRTKANGFGEAGAYLNGETVMEVGGGVCQPSSTLYNAVVLSNLEVTERRNHTYVSSYVPIGRDATVSWGGPDFKFKNNTDYPIKVVSSYSNNRLTMSIVGTDLEDITVEFTSTKLSSTPYNTIEKEDPTLEEGKRKVDVSGYNGAKAQSYRKVYKAGVLISSEKEAYSAYSKRDKVVLVGTKKKETTTPPTDNTTPSTNDTTPSTNDTVPSTDDTTSTDNNTTTPTPEIGQ